MAKILETIKWDLTPTQDNTFTEFEKHLEEEIGKTRRKGRAVTRKVMHVHYIEIDIASVSASEADGDYVAVQISGQHETAILSLSAKNLIWKCKFMLHFQGTPADHWIVNQIQRIPVDFILLKKEAFIAIHTNGVATPTVPIVLHFSYEYINDQQLQRMIARKV